MTGRQPYRALRRVMSCAVHALFHPNLMQADQPMQLGAPSLCPSPLAATTSGGGEEGGDVLLLLLDAAPRLAVVAGGVTGVTLGVRGVTTSTPSSPPVLPGVPAAAAPAPGMDAAAALLRLPQPPVVLAVGAAEGAVAGAVALARAWAWGAGEGMCRAQVTLPNRLGGITPPSPFLCEERAGGHIHSVREAVKKGMACSCARCTVQTRLSFHQRCSHWMPLPLTAPRP